jgi:hypothetical protein
MYRITQDDIDALEDGGCPDSIVLQAKQWLVDSRHADDLVPVIEAAFDKVSLGSGIGLFEAKGVDDYASAEERRALRSRDEKDDWRKIPAEHLDECYSSPSFFDAAGLVFHLPAFIRAELKGTHNYGFFDRLIRDEFSCEGFRDSLTDSQRLAIIQCLEFLKRCPDYVDSIDDIESAVQRYR